jgi:putative FmdB family regulatory protein
MVDNGRGRRHSMAHGEEGAGGRRLRATLLEGTLIMPIYEYLCRGCGKRFEAVVWDSKTPPCPDCGERNLEKQVSTFAVRTSSSPPPASGQAPSCGTCGDPRGPGACSLN